MVVHLMTATTQMGERPDPVAERVTRPITLLDYPILEDAPPNLSWTRRRTPLLRRERESGSPCSRSPIIADVRVSQHWCRWLAQSAPVARAADCFAQSWRLAKDGEVACVGSVIDPACRMGYAYGPHLALRVIARSATHAVGVASHRSRWPTINEANTRT